MDALSTYLWNHGQEVASKKNHKPFPIAYNIFCGYVIYVQFLGIHVKKRPHLYNQNQLTDWESCLGNATSPISKPYRESCGQLNTSHAQIHSLFRTFSKPTAHARPPALCISPPTPLQSERMFYSIHSMTVRLLNTVHPFHTHHPGIPVTSFTLLYRFIKSMMMHAIHLRQWCTAHVHFHCTDFPYCTVI